MANIVVLIGSKRKNGNTDQLAQAFVKGASEHNNVRVFSVANETIYPCIGCDTCFAREGNRCFQKDDMQKIYDALLKADMLVCASPVYMCGVSSQLKAILDRLHTPMRDRFPLKKTALLLAGGSEQDATFAPILAQYKQLTSFFQLEDCGYVFAGGVREKGAIAGHAALDKAYRLGQSICD